MNSDPKPLTVVGATDLERTLLQAARGEQPSPELTARMAAGLGISVGLAATTTASTAQAAGAAPAAMAAPATIGKTAIGAWVTAGVLAVAIGAGVVGGRLYGGRNGDKGGGRTAPAVVAAPVEETPADPAAPPGAMGDSKKRVERVHRRAVAPAAPTADLGDQIALIDAARSAVGARSTERALVLLRRYDSSYPRGAFRPEALALRIEALDQAGRTAEAQALARDFLARYPQSPSVDRVARVAEAKPR